MSIADSGRIGVRPSSGDRMAKSLQRPHRTRCLWRQDVAETRPHMNCHCPRVRECTQPRLPAAGGRRTTGIERSVTAAPSDPLGAARRQQENGPRADTKRHRRGSPRHSHRRTGPGPSATAGISRSSARLSSTRSQGEPGGKPRAWSTRITRETETETPGLVRVPFRFGHLLTARSEPHDVFHVGSANG